MHELRMGVALFLLLMLLPGLARAWRGPTLTDRILVIQLFGTCGVAVLLLLGGDREAAALRNVALVFAVLAAVTVIAFVRFAPSEDVR
ncbi:MAG: pH regulation protein F [Labilithrix sp.]|nr:pH regulation protein F [Labilithrix sp.]MCW5835666.1 pH regulation protein F [Labilithrix sp.]